MEALNIGITYLSNSWFDTKIFHVKKHLPVDCHHLADMHYIFFNMICHINHPNQLRTR